MARQDQAVDLNFFGFEESTEGRGTLFGLFRK